MSKAKKAPKLRPLILKSSQWLRGKFTDNGGSALYVGGRKHQYCCLGVLARECGISARQMIDKGVPGDLLDDKYGNLVKDREDLPEGLRWCVTKKSGSSRDANTAIRWNDDSDITDVVRLKKLVPVFRRNGWDLQFVNDEPEE